MPQEPSKNPPTTPADTTASDILAPLRPRASLWDELKDIRTVGVLLAILSVSNGLADLLGRLVENVMGSGISTAGAALIDASVFFGTLPLSGSIVAIAFLAFRGQLQNNPSTLVAIAVILVVGLVAGALLHVGGVTGDLLGPTFDRYNSLPHSGPTLFLAAILAVSGAYLGLYGAWGFFLGILFGIAGAWAAAIKILPHVQ